MGASSDSTPRSNPRAYNVDVLVRPYEHSHSDVLEVRKSLASIYPFGGLRVLRDDHVTLFLLNYFRYALNPMP
jgi:hypothetical protein